MTNTKDFRKLEGRLGENGRLGISATLLNPDGEIQARIAYRAGECFPMASVVKVPIGMAIEMMCRRGELSLDDLLTIDSESSCPGPPANPLDRIFFLPWESQLSKSIGELLELMLVHSDNTAADALLGRIGGPSAIQSFLSTVGVDGIRMTRSISELLSYFYDLPCPLRSANILRRMASAVRTVFALRSAFRCRPAKEFGLVETGDDTTTPDAMTHLVQLAFSDSQFELVQREMKACLTGSKRIPEGLKACGLGNAGIAHKTGSLGGITNDIGVVARSDQSQTALSILTCGASVATRKREIIIAESTEVVMRSFGGKSDA